MVLVFTKPEGPFSVTMAPGMTAPLSSVIWPRKVAFWANNEADVKKNAKRQQISFNTAEFLSMVSRARGVKLYKALEASLRLLGFSL